MPLEAIGDRRARDKMVATLTHKAPRSARGEAKEPVRMFTTARLGEELLGIPRAYAERVFAGHWPIVYNTSHGHPLSFFPRRPDCNHPSVMEPDKQRKFMDDLSAGMNDYATFLATAGTGTGKTVSFLDAAIVRGRTTFVAVHLDRLLDQWVERLVDLLGVPEDKIAIVKQDSCDWEGKDWGVGLYHSLALREYPREFYRHWGTWGGDEVHKVGSNFFAPVSPLFPTHVKVGLSATMGRPDRGEKIFIYHLGPIRVKSEAKYLPMKVHVVRYKSRAPLWGKDLTARMRCLQVDPVRNRMLAAKIAAAYQAGEQCLAVSLAIEHLQEVMRVCHDDFGIPWRAMGRFFGEVHHGEKLVVDKLGNPVKKKIRTKRKPEELKAVLDKATIVFATYGMMTEGIDVPRLSWGIDLLPQSKATQITGRVRRPFGDKQHATWVTPVDENCVFSQRMFRSRRRDYSSTGAEIVDVGA